jgi:hypothetical protein
MENDTPAPAEHPLGRLISGIYESQSAEWRLGIHTATHMLCALEQSEDGRANVVGAILLSYIALTKTEGYAGGVLGTLGAIKAKATPDGELAAYLQELEDQLMAQKDQVYLAVFGQLIRYIHEQEKVAELPEGLAEKLQQFVENAFPKEQGNDQE